MVFRMKHLFIFAFTAFALCASLPALAQDEVRDALRMDVQDIEPVTTPLAEPPVEPLAAPQAPAAEAVQEASPAKEPQEALHRPQLYDYAGAPVDPLCFLNNIGTGDVPVFPTENCEGEELSSDEKGAPLDEDKFVSSGYTMSLYDEESGQTHTSNGFVGYRAIGHVGPLGAGYEAVVVVENGGGTGIFTSVMLLEVIRDDVQETATFRQHELLATGDRCMGGYVNAKVIDGDLVFRLNTTMADMLGLVGDSERDILRTQAASELPYCAICCYGEVDFDREAFREIYFPEDRHKPDERDSDAAQCVEGLVALNVSNGQDTFNAAAFAVFVDEIEHTCLGRVESE